MKHKSQRMVEAELIIASLLKDMTEDEVYAYARKYKQSKEFAIAQRVTTAIFLCTVWDFYEDFNEQMLKDLYNQYLEYHKSFDKGQEDIFKQMNEVNKMLDGDLLEGKLFDAIRTDEVKDGKNN